MEPEDKLSEFLLPVHPLVLIGVAILLVLICAILYIIQSGIFSRIDVKTIEPSRGPMVVAYKTGKGPYKNAGELFTEACCLVFDREHLGIYYDDPDSTPENDLRYAVGVVLASGSEAPDKAELETMTKHGYKIIHLPKPNYVVMASFPFRNTLSIYMGIFRVYPKLKDYIVSRGLCAYPALEIYTPTAIEFVMPLSKQEEFFVPEFCEEQESIATTEFSNHPDHAGVDEELKSKGLTRNLSSVDEEDDQSIFVKPSLPASARRESINEQQNDAEADDAEASFEKIDPVEI